MQLENQNKRLAVYVLKDAVLDDAFLKSVGSFIPYDDPAMAADDHLKQLLAGDIKGLSVHVNGQFSGHILYEINDRVFYWLCSHAQNKSFQTISSGVLAVVKDFVRQSKDCDYLEITTLRKPVVQFLTDNDFKVTAVTCRLKL